MSLGPMDRYRLPNQGLARRRIGEAPVEREAPPDVITPGEYPQVPEVVRQALIGQIYSLTTELTRAGGPTTEAGEGIARTRAAIYRFFGQATGERPPLPDVDTAASPLPEGSEEAAANERFVDGPVVDGPGESSGYRP